MADAGKKVDAETTTTKHTPLHPVYSVTNVQNKIRTLDGTKVSYSSWVKLFKLHAKAYKVLDHLDETPSPDESSPEHEQWSEIDALVLQWIYSTISDDLLARIIDADITTKKAWKSIETIFLSNKGARAAALEHEFTNMSLPNIAGFDEYCQKLKDIAGRLADLNQPVSDTRLVLQLVKGLPTELETIGTMVNQAVPTWDEARNQIYLEIQRQASRSETNCDSVLLHSQNTTTDSNTQSQTTEHKRPPFQSNYRWNNYDPNFRGRGRGQSWRGGRNRGRGGRSNGGRTSYHQTQKETNI